MGQTTDESDFSPARAAALPASALAGLERRIPAALIDAAIGFVFMLALSTVLLKITDMSLDRAVGPYYVIGTAAAWLYCAGMESGRRGATLGKRIMGLEVLDLAGERPGFARASLRFAVRSLTFVIGWLSIPATQRKQALHDLAAHTVVIRSDRRPT